MTTREKLQAIVDGVEPVGFYYPEDIQENTRTFKCSTTNNLQQSMMPMHTSDQIIDMLEQAYRMALEDAAEYIENTELVASVIHWREIEEKYEQIGGEG